MADYFQESVLSSYCLTSALGSELVPPTASNWPWKVTREDRLTGRGEISVHTECLPSSLVVYIVTVAGTGGGLSPHTLPLTRYRLPVVNPPPIQSLSPQMVAG